MGDKQQKDIYESDQARFGMVDDIQDLERERGVGPNIANHERERLLANANSVGYFEIEGGSKGGLGAPLHLGDEIMKDGAPSVAQYQVAHNVYAQPLRKTFRAMGRLKDLSMTNAPLTPAEVEKDPKLMAHFKNLKVTGPQDGELSKWSESQSNMVTNIKRYAAGQHLLAGAVANYSRVQKGLEAKRKQVEKASQLSQIAEVDIAVQRVHKIVNIATEAWTLAGTIDNIIGSSSLDENAGYADGEVTLDSGAKRKPPGDPSTPNWEHGTADDPAGEGVATATDYGTKKQKAAGALDAITAGTAEAQRIVKDLKTKLSAGHTFDLSIDGVLTAVIGGQQYAELKKEVAVLDAQIRKLGLDAEADDMTAATEALNGFRISASADREQIKNDRASTRNHARRFAGAIWAGNHGVMAMYAAAAYQELAAFGELANQQRDDLMPAWGRAKYYMRTTNMERFVVKNMVSDGRRLAENLGEVIEQRNHFHNHLPQWKATARQWSDFFGTHAHHDLVRKDNAADKAEE